jgi:hypothetical protein
MKKSVFFLVFFILAVLAFGQNLKDYTLISYFYRDVKGTVENAWQPKMIKYAVSSEGGVFGVESNPIPIYWIGNFADRMMVIELTPVQAKEIKTIKQEKDEALILFTRTKKAVSYKTASPTFDLKFEYRLVADKIIPLKNIFGITDSEVNKLPKDFLAQNYMDDIIKLYLDTGKTDPDGRIAKALKK